MVIDGWILVSYKRLLIKSLQLIFSTDGVEEFERKNDAKWGPIYSLF